MTKDEIRAEFEAFMEFHDSSERRYVTTTSALLFAQHIAEKVARTAQKWLPIETAPTKDEGRGMFVVRAFNVANGFTGGLPYTSDPWCVWRCLDGGFARWPHNFAPTHWMPLPAAPECTIIAHTPDEHTNQSASSSG